MLSMTPPDMQSHIKQAYERGSQEARAPEGSNTIGASSVATETGEDRTTSASGHRTAPSHPEPVISDEIGGSSSTMFVPSSQIIPANSVVMTCEGVEVSSSPPGNDQFHFASISLMDFVSDKVKERILANKFVDLASITDKNQSSFEMVLKVDDDESPSRHPYTGIRKSLPERNFRQRHGRINLPFSQQCTVRNTLMQSNSC
ncbi:uncharacterized protein LOC110465080 [Mizuhopecten yessoensis]|uniref:uncharacterized protein LOC110465080 n=1 Tax=Mizuhopecten yessoensis TaxID=6573 RepID=UPI000B4578E9|nr:uncharacterized protein LOC110465080 [Mizuhopecten yessoensis]